MERLILLHEDAVVRSFDGVEAHPFHYRVNVPALIFFVTLGVAIAGGGLAMWHLTELPHPLSGGVIAAGALLAAWAMHWRWVARTSFVAFTEQHLFVGDHKRAWRIERSLLDADVLGFDRMKPSRLRAELELRVGGQEIPLLIFHPMAFAADVEILTASLLAHIASDDEPSEEVAADEEPADVDPADPAQPDPGR
jgi:hypothetical protein